MIDRELMQQALDALEIYGAQAPAVHETITALRERLSIPVFTSCNCRWNGETQVQQCTLHAAHIEAIHEWAERAKTAEAKLKQEPVALEAVYETIIQWDEGGGKRSRRELARRIVALYTDPPAAQRQPLTDDEIWKFWWSRPAVPDGEDDSMEAQFVAAVRAVLAAHGITKGGTA